MRVSISYYCVIRTSTALLAHAMPLVIACLKVVGTYLNRCPLDSRDLEIDHTPEVIHHVLGVSCVEELRYRCEMSRSCTSSRESSDQYRSHMLRWVQTPPGLIGVTAAVAVRC